MTVDTNTIDTTAQVLDTPETETEKTPVEESQPDNTLKIDTIFGELYNELMHSVQMFVANLSIAGMSIEQTAVHAFHHAKTLVEQYHQTALNDAQKSVLTAQLLKDATNPQVPVEPPIADSTPVTEQPPVQQTPADTTQQPSILNNSPEVIDAANAVKSIEATEAAQETASTPVVVATPTDPGTPATGQAVTDFVEESH